MGLFDFWKRLFNLKKKKNTKHNTRGSGGGLYRRRKRKVEKIASRKAFKRGRKIYKSLSKGVKRTKKYRQDSEKKTREREIGIITHYFGKISVGVIRLKRPLRVGEKIHIKGANDDFAQIVTSMQFNHKNISYASRGMEVGIKVIQPVHENDKVYKIVSPEERNSLKRLSL